ncbi:hypothetical protein MKW92_051008 [Papaver armeniacum]|nr:hypothetical protein MKW92_051008 [Papaver armeniacum]
MASSSLSEVSERRGSSFLSDFQTYLTQSGLGVTISLAFLRGSPVSRVCPIRKYLCQYKVLLLLGLFVLLKRKLSAKIPDIDKCLDIVFTLLAKKGTGEELMDDFEVAEAHIFTGPHRESDTVCLWLVANVMLEYTCGEGNVWLASALLQKNLDNAKASLEVVIADLQFLRDQVTIRQVTIARVYNWDVHQRRTKQVTLVMLLQLL